VKICNISLWNIILAHPEKFPCWSQVFGCLVRCIWMLLAVYGFCIIFTLLRQLSFAAKDLYIHWVTLLSKLRSLVPSESFKKFQMPYRWYKEKNAELMGAAKAWITVSSGIIDMPGFVSITAHISQELLIWLALKIMIYR
jgi:hypothetical protein